MSVSQSELSEKGNKIVTNSNRRVAVQVNTSSNMTFVIKAEVRDLGAKTFAFCGQKTMYNGKHIAQGDRIFVFASENEAGPGLIASGVVTSAKAIAKKPGLARQTPRVSITVRRTAVTAPTRKGLSPVAWAMFIIVALLLVLAIVSVIFAPAIMRSADKNRAMSAPQPSATAPPSLGDTIQNLLKQRITDELQKSLPGKMNAPAATVPPHPGNQPTPPPHP